MTRINGSSLRKVRTARARLWLRPFAVAFVLVALAAPAWSAAPDSASKPGSDSGSGVLVNINTASAEELQALPGIGEARAAQIVALRKERGAFRNADELLEVRGIGPAMLERLRPQVALSGKTRLGAAAAPSGAAGPARKDGR